MSSINFIEETHATVQFKFKSPNLRAEREPLCKRVLNHFQHLPACKLLCYIDDEMPGYFPAMDSIPARHRSFSGLHVPIRGGGRWPPHVEEWFFTSDQDFAFDNLIYIPGTTYANDPATFVMILAHEFQHFAQYGESETGWKVHDILFCNVGRFDQSAGVWDIPDERDAMIVSKHVAEAEFGVQAVQRLMERQIADANNSSDLAKRELWIFLSNLSSAEVHDWREETCGVIERYRLQLESTVSSEKMELLNSWVRLQCKSSS